MSAATISAIIASYNQESFIEESVLSIADQVDEVIVVDDVSPDNTLEVLKRIRHPRLRVVANDRNLGVSRTFNRAASLATSDILIIQGGDDRSSPSRAAVQRDVLEDPSVILTYSRPSVITSAGFAAPDRLAADFFPSGSSLGHIERLLFENNYICAPSVAVRRGDYALAGGFGPALDLLQDYDLWLRLGELGEIVETPDEVVSYRKHASNLSRDYVGVDSAKHRRLRAEQHWVRNSFLDRALEPTLDALGESRVPNVPGGFASLDRTAKIALLKLGHPDKTLKRSAVEYIIGQANAPDGDGALDRLGLRVADLPWYMSQADHDNMDVIDQMLSAGAPGERVRVLTPIVRPSPSEGGMKHWVRRVIGNGLPRSR